MLSRGVDTLKVKEFQKESELPKVQTYTLKDGSVEPIQNLNYWIL
jgi:hypothetical protein